MLITSTITISFLASMVLFGAIIHTIGPVDGRGDIQTCFKKKQKALVNDKTERRIQ